MISPQLCSKIGIKSPQILNALPLVKCDDEANHKYTAKNWMEVDDIWGIFNLSLYDTHFIVATWHSCHLSHNTHYKNDIPSTLNLCCIWNLLIVTWGAKKMTNLADDTLWTWYTIPT